MRLKQRQRFSLVTDGFYLTFGNLYMQGRLARKRHATLLDLMENAMKHQRRCWNSDFPDGWTKMVLLQSRQDADSALEPVIAFVYPKKQSAPLCSHG